MSTKSNIRVSLHKVYGKESSEYDVERRHYAVMCLDGELRALIRTTSPCTIHTQKSAKPVLDKETQTIK
jgi:hypothetical protein